MNIMNYNIITGTILPPASVNSEFEGWKLTFFFHSSLKSTGESLNLTTITVRCCLPMQTSTYDTNVKIKPYTSHKTIPCPSPIPHHTPIIVVTRLIVQERFTANLPARINTECGPKAFLEELLDQGGKRNEMGLVPLVLIRFAFRKFSLRQTMHHIYAFRGRQWKTLLQGMKTLDIC